MENPPVKSESEPNQDEALYGEVSPDENNNRTQRTLEARSTSYSGPIPPPEFMTAYKQIDSNMPDRIISQAENQSIHRQEMEAKAMEMERYAMEHDFIERRRGQHFGLLIGIAVLACTAYLGSQGMQVAASILGASGLAGLVGVFVYGRKQHESSGSDDTNN